MSKMNIYVVKSEQYLWVVGAKSKTEAAEYCNKNIEWKLVRVNKSHCQQIVLEDGVLYMQKENTPKQRGCSQPVQQIHVHHHDDNDDGYCVGPNGL